MKKYVVVEDWEASYDNPIVLKKDEQVILDLSVTDSDSEWQDWV